MLRTHARQLDRRGSCDFAGGMLAFDGYPVNRLTTGCCSGFHDFEGGLADFQPIHELWMELILIVCHGLLLSVSEDRDAETTERIETSYHNTEICCICEDFAAQTLNDPGGG